MTHPVRAAIEARDIDALAALLSDGIEFHSPVAFHPFVGRDTVAEVLANVLEVFSDFRYTDELAGEGAHALIFSAKVGERSVEGLDHLVLDADGLVERFTVMVRPLSGLVALAEAMGPRVAHLAKG
jgi:hypothetical protein